MSTPADEALDALELMVQQYLWEHAPGCYDHSFMMAGEYAAQVLAIHRPDVWEATPIGVRRLDRR